MASASGARLRILHIATHSGVYRGGAVQACRMANAQQALGHRVSLIFSTRTDKGEPAPESDAATWDERLDPAIIPEGVDLWTRLGRWRLRHLIRRFNPDVVHAHRDTALGAAFSFARKYPRVAFVAQRGTTTPPPDGIAPFFRSERLDGVVAVADAVRDVLITLGVPAEKVRTIYGSVDLARYAPAPRDAALRRELGYEESHFVVGSLSSYRKAKGFELMAESIGLALRERPELRFLFLGNRVEQEIAGTLREAGALEACRFVGHQPNVERWLRAMDATVVAAFAREGLSGVLRESLAAAVPVISTDSDGNPEIVRHHETGLLVPRKHAGALAEAFVWAASNPGRMAGYAAAGREWVLRHCAPEVQAVNLESFYRELLERRRHA